jgi:hypothetical protein
MEQIAVCSRQVAVFFPADTIKKLGDFVLQGPSTEQMIFSLVPPTHISRSDHLVGQRMLPSVGTLSSPSLPLACASRIMLVSVHGVTRLVQPLVHS